MMQSTLDRNPPLDAQHTCQSCRLEEHEKCTHENTLGTSLCACEVRAHCGVDVKKLTVGQTRKVIAAGKRAVKAVSLVARTLHCPDWTVDHLRRAADGLENGDRAVGAARRWPNLAARLRNIAKETDHA